MSRPEVSLLAFLLLCASSPAADAGEGPYSANDPGVTLPVLIHKNLPVFPGWAMERGIQGKVTLEAVIRKDGTVGDIVVVHSEPAGLGFEAAAVQAIRSWRYEPGTKDGEPVDISFMIVVESTGGRPPRLPYPSGQEWAEYLVAASNALDEGQLDVALENAQGALAEAETFPSDDPRLPPALELLATVHVKNQDVAMALPLLEHAQSERRARSGNRDPGLLPLLDTLSTLYMIEGRVADAEAPLVRAIGTLNAFSSVLVRGQSGPWSGCPISLDQYTDQLLGNSH